ncbi:MAG: class I SAM-dependent methyltransferase [Clostridia bacterium]|nr:class I SAM-dependent methyltransferase [Clostridia bacterium]
MNENNLRHYFVTTKHNESEYFEFKEMFEGVLYTFKSCSDVFSKKELDYGSKVLVKNIIENKDIFGGKIMDMCCGYGTIAILLDKNISAEYYLCDINETAVDLAKHNAVLNKTSIKLDNITCGNMFEGNIDTYSHVVSNPPIKAGKKYLLEFVDGAFSHLENKGTLTLVIKKNLGADSLKKYLTNLFGNCEVWDRDKGYYILHSKKQVVL